MDSDIRSQDKHYRRGMILGLTMAETMLLIIFALMLALAAALVRRDNETTELRAQVEGLQARLALIAPTPDEHRKLDDIFQDLKRVQAENDRLKAANSEIPDLREKIKQAEQLHKDLVEAKVLKQDEQRPADAQAIARKIDLAEKVMDVTKASSSSSAILDPSEISRLIGAGIGAAEREANLKGQIANLTTKLKAVPGKGADYPPCWADEQTGKIEYIFDISITQSGMVIRNNPPERRKEQEKGLPISGIIEFDHEISIPTFIRETAAIYDWSRTQDPECRFFVRRYDLTRDEQKSVYKAGMEAIQGHFYPYNVKDVTGAPQ